MAYALSATKLLAYCQCPRSYHYRYERRLPGSSSFANPVLGRALHVALARIYADWHYAEPRPEWGWLERVWQQVADERSLEDAAVREGSDILQRYYRQHVASRDTLHRPLGIEGRISARIERHNLLFDLSGRYDRIDWLEDGLELFDYKTSKSLQPLDRDRVTIQLGLYALALRVQYGEQLRFMTAIHLRHDRVERLAVSSDCLAQTETAIARLAQSLREESDWSPQPSDRCRHCPYTDYCEAVSEKPCSLPDTARRPAPLQLGLSLQRQLG